ncbi:MAG: polysaccharide biosynthesis C-terminal domain-containing protein, partial [Armatimonadetes bacterium]|nr:polysaccharide biosynthesis C-terminal domain-containing protein [Armatimonadota bacterium]
FGLRVILAINIPASTFMVLMADPIVRTAYMSGEFTPAKVGATSVALVWYSVGIFAWAGQAIVARGFFAMQDTLTPVLLGSAVTLVFIPLNYVLMHTMGHGGLALATSIAATIHLLALTAFLRRRLHGLEGGKIASLVLKVLASSAVMAASLIVIRSGLGHYVNTFSRKGAAIEVLLCMVVASVIYLGLLKITRAEEAEFIWRMLSRRFAKRGPNDSTDTAGLIKTLDEDRP